MSSVRQIESSAAEHNTLSSMRFADRFKIID
jgi:hypothetical protein